MQTTAKTHPSQPEDKDEMNVLSNRRYSKAPGMLEEGEVSEVTDMIKPEDSVYDLLTPGKVL